MNEELGDPGGWESLEAGACSGGVSVKLWHFGNDGKFSKINPNSVHL